MLVISFIFQPWASAAGLTNFPRPFISFTIIFVFLSLFYLIFLCKWRGCFHFRIKFSGLVERKRYDLLVVGFIFEANCRGCGGG